jgi:pilus assembly protein Flp/PilA
MNKFFSSCRQFVRSLRADTVGANMVEYLVVVGLVALAASAGFKTFGDSAKSAVTQQGTQVKALGGGGK